MRYSKDEEQFTQWIIGRVKSSAPPGIPSRPSFVVCSLGSRWSIFIDRHWRTLQCLPWGLQRRRTGARTTMSSPLPQRLHRALAAACTYLFTACLDKSPNSPFKTSILSYFTWLISWMVGFAFFINKRQAYARPCCILTTHQMFNN